MLSSIETAVNTAVYCPVSSYESGGLTSLDKLAAALSFGVVPSTTPLYNVHTLIFPPPSYSLATSIAAASPFSTATAAAAAAAAAAATAATVANNSSATTKNSLNKPSQQSLLLAASSSSASSSSTATLSTSPLSSSTQPSTSSSSLSSVPSSPPTTITASATSSSSISSPYMMIYKQRASNSDAVETVSTPSAPATPLSNAVSSGTQLFPAASNYEQRYLSDDDDENMNDLPLDLSVRRKEPLDAASSSTSANNAQTRPSVIRNSYGERHVDMRRSASSVSSRPKPEPDVSEHFRRSLSGKWPRRQTNHTHYTPPQNDKDRKNDITIKRHNSSPGYENSRQSPPFCMSPGKKNVIVKDYGIDIEEHFRRALGADKYEMLIKNRNLN